MCSKEDVVEFCDGELGEDGLEEGFVFGCHFWVELGLYERVLCCMYVDGKMKFGMNG